MRRGLTPLLVGLGGGAGAVSRVLVARAAERLAFPGWSATLAVNVAGCLAIGWVVVVLERRFASRGETLRQLSGLLMTGLLGGFTTFSSFSVEALELVQRGEAGRAVVLVAASLVVCVAATSLGMRLGQDLAGTR